jgi:hypothetical protein
MAASTMSREEYLEDRINRLSAALHETRMELAAHGAPIILKNDARRADNMARIAAGQPVRW